MRDGDANVSLWLLAWHGRAEDGLSILTELGMGPEDARRALSSTPSLLARELSPSTAREVADRLEAMGGRVEVRALRQNAPASMASTVKPMEASSAAPRARILVGRIPWVRLVLVLLVIAVAGGGYGFARRMWRRASSSWLFASTEERTISRGILEEARNHRDDPVVARLFHGLANAEPEIEKEAVRAHLRGLQYFSHEQLVRFFGVMRRVIGAPNGCDPDQRSLSVLTEAEQLDTGRLIAISIALGAHERRRTGGHERAVEEGVRFAYRRLPAHEQQDFEELATRAERDEIAMCEWTLALFEATDAMHADLQRRFLRAFAYHIGEIALEQEREDARSMW
jgi:hypothetical protein